MTKTLLLGLLLTLSICSVHQQITISSVSLSRFAYVPAQGPQSGGSTLYITGDNFKFKTSEMNIYIGPYPCDIFPEVVNNNIIKCKTTKMLEKKFQKNLSIAIYSRDSLKVICSSVQCRFSYSENVPALTVYNPQNITEQPVIKQFTQSRLLQYNQCPKGWAFLQAQRKCVFCNSFINADGQSNPFQNYCYCEPFFAWDSFNGGCKLCYGNNLIVLNYHICFACQNAQFSLGTKNTANQLLCDCEAGLIFDQYKAQCVCPKVNTIYLDKQCFACSSIPKYGTGFSLSNNNCQCKNTFAFNNVTKTCVCPLSNSIINTVINNGQCFHCGSIANYSNGLVSTDGKSCQCNAPFVFSFTLNYCICPKPNNIAISGVCFDCNSGDIYSTNLANTALTTCLCSPTFTFNFSAKKCVCPLPNSFINNGACFSCTSIALYSNGLINSTTGNTCQCFATFVFSLSTNTCICPNANSIINNQACFSCDSIPKYSNHLVNTTNNKLCQCDSTFVFSLSVNNCICPIANSIINNGQCFACGLIPIYSNGLINTTTGNTCQCNSTFVFNTATNNCVCPVPNSIINKGVCFPCGSIASYSNRLVNLTTGNTCQCDNTFVFNSATNTCECPVKNSIINKGACFPCGLITLYSNGLINITTGNTCQCDNTFTFNTETNTCECPVPNSIINKGVCFPCGSIINYSNGLVNSTTGNTCQCDSTFYFNQATNICECPISNSIINKGACFPCGLITLYSNGLVNTTTGNTCQCNSTFAFNTATNTCACPIPNSIINKGSCFPCGSVINYSSGLINVTTGNTCQCNNTFSFNLSTNTCECPIVNSIINNGACFPCGLLKDKNGTGNIINKLCECNSSFVFIQSNNICICPGPTQNSYINNNGLCISCSSLGNGTGFANIASRECICKETYIFKQKSGLISCQCAPNSIILEGKCFSCSNLGNSSGFVNASAENACQCTYTYVFNKSKKVCQCPDPNSYISLAKTCVSCSVKDSIGRIANQLNMTCDCPPTYAYYATFDKCYCKQYSFVTSDNKCFGCFQIRYKNATGLIDQKTGTCQCYFSYVFNIKTYVCQCPDPNSYVSRDRVCVSCTNIGNNTGFALIQAKACQCLGTYVYNYQLNKCLCPSSSIILNNQCFVCSTLSRKNSTGKADIFSVNACQCYKSFVFNTAKKVCQCPDANSYISKQGLCVSCTGLANGLNIPFAENKTCACKDTYFYNSTINKCLCPPNSIIIEGACFQCSTLRNKNSSGTLSVDGKNCLCRESFIFNRVTKVCECPDPNSYISISGRCISCTGVENSNEIVFSNKTCGCNETYIYNSFSNKCLCPQTSIILDNLCFQCSSLRNKNSSGKINTTTSNACECFKSFAFNPSSKICECPDPNSYISNSGLCVSCTGVDKSNQIVFANKTCGCNHTYVYSSTLNKCICPVTSIILQQKCFQCSTLKNKNSSGVINPTTGNTCQCYRSFVFNPTAKVCQCPDPNSYVSQNGICVSCTNIGNNTNEVSILTKTCICTITFIYSSTLNKCLCPATSIIINNVCFVCSSLKDKNSTGTVNISAASACRCDRSYVFNSVNKACECPDSNSYVSAAKLCVSCSNVGNSTKKVVGKACECLPNFIYNPNLNQCLCPSYKIYSEVDGSCSVISKSAKNIFCPQNLIWNIFTESCGCEKQQILKGNQCVECSSLKNSTGIMAADGLSCICSSGFEWKQTNYSCQ